MPCNNSEVYLAANNVAAASVPKLITNLTNTAQNVVATEANLYGVHLYNPNGAGVYVQIFNVVATSVTLGTTDPSISFYIPATGGYDIWPIIPILHADAGISIAATATVDGSGSPGAAAIVANVFYK